MARFLFLLLFVIFLQADLVYAEKPCHWLGTPPACYGFTPFTCPEGTSELARASDATNNKFADFGDSKCYWGERTLCCKNEILRLENGAKPKHCEGGFNNGCPPGRIQLAVERSGVTGMPTDYTSFCCERDTMKPPKMLVYKDAFTGDVLCTEECPVTTVDDFVYEFTGRVSIRSGDSIVPEDDFNGDGFDEVGIDFVLRHKLAPTGKQISSLDEFVNTYGKSIVEQVTKSADFGGDEEAFSNQCMSWASSLFDDADRASKIQFYASPNFVEGERGQICLVEFRGEEQVPTLILLKAATVTEEQ